MRVAVVGPGGVGGYVGARLAAAGADVHLVARGEHLTALQQQGLQVDSVRGDVHVEVPAVADAAAIGPCDVVLFCVKAYDTEAAAARHLPPLCGEDTAVISLQNGVDNEERIAEVVGREHAVGGLAQIFAHVARPGVIAHTGGPASLVVGELDGRSSDRLDRFRSWCTQAGVDVGVTDDIQAALWHKFGFICAQAGTTAVVRLPIGDIRQTPETWALFATVVAEADAVARAAGVAVADDALATRLAFAQDLDAGLYSSLHDDLVAGRRMELEALHGTLIRLAREHDVPAPATTAVHALLAPWARRNAGTS
jgi:2-dehydropantoate 2-reductase